MSEIVEYALSDAEPSLRCDRGVTFVASADRTLHRPDLSLALVDRGSLVARCSCWINQETQLGVVGHYAAASADAAAALLEHACAVVSRQGCATAVGPMDGNTWRRYRLAVEGNVEAPFFLEPTNPGEWPAQWTEAGFLPCATYTSSLNEDLSVEDSRTSGCLERLTDAGISIRALDVQRVESELHHIFTLSTRAFRNNPFYAPITEEEFRIQIGGLLPMVRPELVLLAERDGDLAGFVFAVPDLLRTRHGFPSDTAIIKTLAVDPAASGMGLGSVLMDLAHRAARRIGFRRVIHALMHERNASGVISARYARTIRRYALFSRQLGAAQ